jgi:hypothetical protein
LKEQKLRINRSTVLVLEYGRIGNLNIQLPWSKLYLGRVDCTVDDVDIVVRIDADHGEELNSSQSNKQHDAKMVWGKKLSSPYLKLRHYS